LDIFLSHSDASIHDGNRIPAVPNADATWTPQPACSPPSLLPAELSAANDEPATAAILAAKRLLDPLASEVAELQSRRRENIEEEKEGRV